MKYWTLSISWQNKWWKLDLYLAEVWLVIVVRCALCLCLYLSMCRWRNVFFVVCVVWVFVVMIILFLYIMIVPVDLSTPSSWKIWFTHLAQAGIGLFGWVKLSSPSPFIPPLSRVRTKIHHAENTRQNFSSVLGALFCDRLIYDITMTYQHFFQTSYCYFTYSCLSPWWIPFMFVATTVLFGWTLARWFGRR